MSLVLLVDFGASRIKVALWDPDHERSVARAELPSPTAPIREDGSVEIPGEEYWRALEAAVAALQSPVAREVDRLWLCSEMHGFLLADEAGRPASPYVSWRDQRATRDGGGSAPSTLESLLAEHAQPFRAATGMRLRSGLPCVTLASMVRRGTLPGGRLRVLTLADWLLVRGGCRSARAHRSLAASTGLLDVRSGEWSGALLGIAGLAPEQVILPTFAEPGEPLGEVELGGRRIVVHGGIGDLQAALVGAGLLAGRGVAAVNLGTGSQVATEGDDLPDAPFEIRPAARGGRFRAMTHIPSGRALTALARWLDGCAAAGGGAPFFWRLWCDLEPDEVLGSPVRADLNLFDAAWRSGPDTGWLSLREEWLDPRTMLAGIARSWLDQYREALELLDLEGRIETVRVAGGLARRSRFVVPVLAALCGREVIAAQPMLDEETLDGLRLLAGERG